MIIKFKIDIEKKLLEKKKIYFHLNLFLFSSFFLHLLYLRQIKLFFQMILFQQINLLNTKDIRTKDPLKVIINFKLKN